MKPRSILKITILISILLHIAIILAIRNINFNLKEESKSPKKVELSFKRGGDSMKKNSPIKENTPLNAKKIAKDSNKGDSIESIQSFDIANNSQINSFDLSSLSLNPTPNEQIQNLLQEFLRLFFARSL